VYGVAFLFVGTALSWSNVIDRYFIYFPSREITTTPADVGLDYDDVTFETDDGVTLHGWFVAGTTQTTVVWFHGNAGNISNRVPNILALHESIGVNILIFDYRGYGRSEGTPSEQGTYQDAEAAIRYVRSRSDVDSDQLIYFGRSLGCAVAAEMALSAPPWALVLESGFTSVKAMARRAYPFAPGIELLVRAKYDAVDKVGRVDVPVMVLHGTDDDIVPFEMGEQLFEVAQHQSKRFYAIDGAGHNDTYEVGGAHYFGAIASFVASLSP